MKDWYIGVSVIICKEKGLKNEKVSRNRCCKRQTG